MCSMWSEWGALHTDTVFDWLLVLVLVLLSIQIEGTVFVGGESLC